MAETVTPFGKLSRTAKIAGTVFLVFQILFAANSFGPQKIPGLNLLFDGPWVKSATASSRVGDSSALFKDVAASAGLAAFRHAEFYDADPSYVEVMGGGVAVGDYDGDGWEDVFLTNMPAFHSSVSSGTPSTLFRNRGDGTFEDVTAAARLTDLRGYPQGAIFLDYDNDGDQDLYVAAYAGGQLFRNDAARFTDVTRETGLDLTGKCGEFPCFGSSVVAADYDRNGRLDLLVVNNVNWDIGNPASRGRSNLFPVFFSSQPTMLFRGLPNGTFEDATAASGLDNDGGKGLAAAWLDVNGDLWPDAYIANDLSHNRLYVNNADGTFREIGKASGTDEIKSDMGVGAADYDNDGDFDFVATNLKGVKLSLYRNEGGEQFTFVTDDAGLASSAATTGWGVEFVDFDLDGHMDLVMSGGPVWEPVLKDTQNLLFRNLGDGTFVDVSKRSGDLYDKQSSRGLAILDFDNDGDPDLVVANVDGAAPLLLQNSPKRYGHWLQVRLEGLESNRDGVGARVEVLRTDGLRMTQEVRAGSSYESGSTRLLFFGLNQSAAVELKVHWPSGEVDLVKALPWDARILVRESAGVFERLR